MPTTKEPIFSFRVTGLLDVNSEDLFHDFADQINVINGLSNRLFLAGTFRYPDFVAFHHPENGEAADSKVFHDADFLASGDYGRLWFHSDAQHVYTLDFSSAAALAYLVVIAHYYPTIGVTVTHCDDAEVLENIYTVVSQVNNKVPKPEWMKDIEQKILFRIDRPSGLDFRG